MTKESESIDESGVDATGVRYSSHEEERSLVNEGPFDLEERTARYAEAIIDFAQALPVNAVNISLISQIVRSGTSIGANYCEADDAVSKKEFRLNINTCRKEARETKFWLRMIAKAAPASKDAARPLWQEAKELHLIFCAILRNSRTTND